MKLKLSGSGLDRVDRCAGSVALPVVQRGDDKYAGRGTALHDFLANVGRIGKAAALERVPEEWRPACETINLDALPQIDPSQYAAEVSILLDVFTGRTREIGRGEGRAAYAHVEDRKETEIGLTIDTLGISPDAAIVYDYKTGWAPITHPRRNWQLRSYGLGAAIQFERPAALVGIVRIPENDDPWTREALLSAFDLDSILIELQELFGRASEQIALAHHPLALTLSVGPWCRHCDAFAYCPAQRALIDSVASNPEGFVTESLALLTSNHASEALFRLVAAEKAIERVREAVKAYARTQPIPMEDGRVYGPVPGKDVQIDAEACAKHIEEVWGSDASKAAVSKEATKSAIERAAKIYKHSTGTKKSLKDLVEQTLFELKTLGAVREVPKETIKEHSAGRSS